jgi:predicted lipoprotein with Yx(FWY)xxD motif
MRRSTIRFVAAAALAALALAACSSSSKGTSSNTTQTTTAATTTTAALTPTSAVTAGPKTVALATNSKFGKIMVDSKGMTLYVLERDTPGKSTCTGSCLTIWPAVAAPASPTFGAGLTASMFSTITRDDGTKQLAVNGSPLYTFGQDTAAGDAKGQDVAGFYVVKANGKKWDPGATPSS